MNGDFQKCLGESERLVLLCRLLTFRSRSDKKKTGLFARPLVPVEARIDDQHDILHTTDTSCKLFRPLILQSPTRVPQVALFREPSLENFDPLMGKKYAVLKNYYQHRGGARLLQRTPSGVH